MRGTLTIHHEPILEANEVIIEAVAMKYGFRMEYKSHTSVEIKDVGLPEFPDCETEKNIDKWLDNLEDWLIQALEGDGWGEIVRRCDISKLKGIIHFPRGLRS